MFKSVFCFVLLLVFSQAVLGDKNDLKTDDEKLSVAVKIIEENDEENGPRKTEVYVNLKVTIEEDNVKVNGKLTELNHLIKYELKAEIVYSPEDVRISPVVVHVMVTRKELENGHQYLIEEQVQFIEGKKVEQLDVQILTIHMNVDGLEFKRTTEIVSFEESNIKKTELTRYCGQDDESPQELLKDPVTPDESGWGRHMHHNHHDHDHKHHHHDDDDENEKDHKHKHHGKSFCSRFHKLPFAARIAILIGLVFIVLASLVCCTMCCCRKKKSAYQISTNKAEDFKAEFDMDEDEAEPLPDKLAFDDKDVLIA